MRPSEYRQIIRDHLKSAYLLSDEKIDALLPGFLETLRSHLEDLEHVLNGGDVKAMNRRAGHTIKGALLNLGLKDLAAIALAIEKSCLDRKGRVEHAILVGKLKAEIEKII
ncbi:Hpt domain protein [bacterium BMS3Bbin14]|nr:Hpt domain protein [bacterium BMS3Abin13]GBE52821.1 Hpt domain protein [bacterium BMS3Bbin14]HDO30542.1 Hpt domain-containing protein [Desulfobacteraceae bacterium]